MKSMLYFAALLVITGEFADIFASSQFNSEKDVSFLLKAHGVGHPVDSRPNVMMLIADDMRPEMGAYAQPGSYAKAAYAGIRTPHLDGLAARSLVLNRAYSQMSLSSPSRTSFFTGRRPDVTRVYDNSAYWRNPEVGGANFTTLPQYFRENGYTTLSLGKVFHGLDVNDDYPFSWSGPPFHPSTEQTSAWTKERRYAFGHVDEEKRKTHPLEDDIIKDEVVATLKKLKLEQNPFFLAVGFHRPGHPWLCPEKYFDMYRDVPLPVNPYAPTGMPGYAWSDFADIRQYKDVKQTGNHGSINTTLPTTLMVELRRAYYACVSYVDSLVGEVLDAVEENGFGYNTVITFMGDHGYQLGEHGEWEKQTNFDLANHVPLFLRVPGKTDSGMKSNHLVELIDLFPTLVEIAGLKPIPQCKQEWPPQQLLCTEGLSFTPLLNQSATLGTYPVHWKAAVFSQFLRFGSDTSILLMGYSVTTSRYRYTEWRKLDWYTLKYSGKDIKARELYDHRTDPHETVNHVWTKSYALAIDNLHELLHDGWQGALPDNKKWRFF